MMVKKPNDLSEDAWRLLLMVSEGAQLRLGPYVIASEGPEVHRGWLLSDRAIVKPSSLAEQLVNGCYIMEQKFSHLDEGPFVPGRYVITSHGGAVVRGEVEEDRHGRWRPTKAKCE
jgi:hypothetical protein